MRDGVARRRGAAAGVPGFATGVLAGVRAWGGAGGGSGRAEGAAAAPPAVQGSGQRRIVVDGRGLLCVAGAQKRKFSSFADMLEGSSAPVLVDFYASWCGPCVMMQQELKKVQAQMGKDRISIFKVNTETYPKLATKYQVEGLPTLVLFRNGEEVGRFEGAMTAADLVQKLEYFLST